METYKNIRILWPRKVCRFHTLFVVVHAKQYPFQAEVCVQLLSPLEQYINCRSFHDHNTCIL